MVDLAKIRKKAKKSAGGEPSSLQVSGPSPHSEAPREPEVSPEVSPAAPPTVPSPPPADAESRSTGDSKLERFMERAGRRREVREERAEEETAHDQLELLTFTIAGEQYAVDIERIVEIVTPRPVTRVPNADPSIVGIISLRGTIVTLVDARRRLRHGAGSETPDTRIVVIDLQSETVGFVVDRVQRVVKLTRSAVEPHPVVHPTELHESIRGVFRTGGALTILLDLDKLLDHSHGPDL